MNHTVDHKLISHWIYISGKMCKMIKNKKFTEKILTESCCTQKWEQSNLSALQIIRIKMVLCQGCSQSISTFLCLIVHKEVVTVEVVSPHGLRFAALWIPWCEEHLPIHAEQFPQCPAVRALSFQSHLGVVCGSVDSCNHSVSLSSFVFSFFF